MHALSASAGSRPRRPVTGAQALSPAALRSFGRLWIPCGQFSRPAVSAFCETGYDAPSVGGTVSSRLGPSASTENCRGAPAGRGNDFRPSPYGSLWDTGPYGQGRLRPGLGGPVVSTEAVWPSGEISPSETAGGGYGAVGLPTRRAISERQRPSPDRLRSEKNPFLPAQETLSLR